MSHVPPRKWSRFSPLEQASLVFLAAAVPASGLWLWVASAAPGAAKGPVVWGGGPITLLTCLVAGTAAYFAGTARRSYELIARNGADAARLGEEVVRLNDLVPALARHIRETSSPAASADTAPAGLPQPADGALRRLLQTVAGEIAESERRAAEKVAESERRAAEEIAESERRAAEATAALAALEEEATRLLEETLPTVVKRIADRASAETVLAEVPHPGNDTLRRLLRVTATEIGAADRRGAAAMTACADAAARIQAQTTSLLARLRELQERYDEQEVFGDLLELDHRVSQLGRRADSIAVLSGGRSGRRWTKPIVMESILRGAMGRIDAYRRIRLHSTSTVAVAGHAAEGVMHVLAELMDNATSFSPHGTEVHVYVEEEDAGVVVTIEDAGLGMRRRERQRAELLVSRQMDLTGLSGTRLGLAVVGRLAGKHGLGVSFRPSSRGGIGVVVMIPRRLIVQPKPDPGPPSRTGDSVPGALPAPTEEAAVTGDAQDLQDDRAARDDRAEEHELPKRRRGETLADAPPSRQSARAAAERANGGARFAAFRQARGRGGERASAPERG